MMPVNLLISLPFINLSTKRRIGVPLITTPSYSKLTLFISAKSINSFSAKARGPLFVVDTCLPLASAQRQCDVAACPVTESVTVASTIISALLFLIMSSLSAFAFPFRNEAKAPSATGNSLSKSKSIPSGEYTDPKNISETATMRILKPISR